MAGGIANIIGESVYVNAAYWNLVEQATQNPDSDIVVLGKFDEGGVSHIDVVIKKEATYYLDQKVWEETSKKLGEKICSV